MNDEEKIQKDLEAGKPANTSDELAYQYVFRALKKELNVNLPTGFADALVMQIQKRNENKRSIFEILLAILGGISILVGLIFTITVMEFKPDFGFLTAVGKYKGVFIFGMAFILIINFFDRYLMRKKEAV
jgi:hypothetical protein